MIPWLSLATATARIEGGGGQPTGYVERVVAVAGLDGLGWLLAVNGVLLVGWGVRETLKRAERRRAAWRDAGPLAGMSFEHRVAARLEEMGGHRDRTGP